MTKPLSRRAPGTARRLARPSCVASLAAALGAAPAGLPGQQPGNQGIPEPDSVISIEPLNVAIGRLRAGTVPLARTPFSSQVVTSGELDPVAGGAIAGALSGLPGVTLTNQTGSPSQMDVRVRGFAVSPIVGVPQSVSVFVDGVRVNEADASQVHLSLIPEGAIERVELIRGPVGVFGKNSVAGALNFVTRRAGDAPSVEAEVQGGSFGSAAGTLRASAPLGSAFDGLLVGSYRRSDGWRHLESAEELSLFGKLGWRGERTDAWISYTFEVDSLEGPGPLPESWIEGGPLPPDVTSPPDDRRRLQYTGGVGDAFRPRLHFVNGRVERSLSERSSLHVSSFGRFVGFRQANDNISEPDALGLTDIASYGSTVQLLHRPGERLLLAAGTEWTRNDVDIEIRERPNRSFPTLTEATTERLRTDEDNLGGFAEAWWSASERVALYGSLRYDWVSLPVTDVLDPSDSGENTFSELSGGLGLSVDLDAGLGAFAGYGRGFRAPVIIEVTCADPADPCQLPFELGPDPPLKPVKSDTWQAGLRLSGSRAQASLVGYWIEVRDDIFNVIDEETPTLGYFTNLARTRRVGVEAFAAGAPLPGVPGLTLTGSAAWTRATFQSEAELASPLVEEPDDPGAPPPPPGPDGEGAVHVEPGDLFPMVPQLSGTLGARYRAGATSLEVEAQWTGRQFLVGDEGNEEEFPKVASSTVVDVRVEHTVRRATVYLELANALDTEFNAFGIISENGRNTPESVERFLTPGSPRRLTLGVSVRVVG
ncbi:MAG TPA: TonB-dependent receptor [Longimicrobiales bacterium]|nr:TonB-dependent receptor [Longimicrobiales bacterium]